MLEKSRFRAYKLESKIPLWNSKGLRRSQRDWRRMFATAIRYIGRKPKPKMKPIELKTPQEQTQTITRTIFDILKEHGPLTIAETWERVKDVGLRGLASKRHMKIVLRWMRERQKLKIICNHVGPQKQFLYTTWLTKPNIMHPKPVTDTSWPNTNQIRPGYAISRPKSS